MPVGLGWQPESAIKDHTNQSAIGRVIARPQPTWLYHFTHPRHLATVISDGMWCDTVMQENGLLETEVGHRGVKERRRSRPVDVGPGGVTADYVPFYYAPRSPMMYVINQGKVDEYQEGLDPLVYLVTTPEALSVTGCEMVVSDGNCANAITEFSADLDTLDEMVDWELMEATWWNNTDEDGDRMRRRAAEFLVHQHLPWSAIQRVATRTESILERAQTILDSHRATPQVELCPNWYY